MGRINFVVAAVEEGASEGKRHMEGAIVSFFGCAAPAVVGEETIQSVVAVGTGEVDAETGCRGFSLSSGKDSVAVSREGAGEGKKHHPDWEGPVVVEKDSNLSRWMAASLVSLQIPR